MATQLQVFPFVFVLTGEGSEWLQVLFVSWFIVLQFCLRITGDGAQCYDESWLIIGLFNGELSTQTIFKNEFK